MSVVKFERPTISMVQYIADHMRDADKAEVWASNRKTPLQSLVEGWAISEKVAIVTVNNVPCVMMGLVVRDILTGTGIPWMLGTNGAVKHRKQFMKLSPPVIEEMLDVCPMLYNYVHAENTVSIEWLKRLGFIIDPPIQYGPDGELFHKFHIERI